MLFDYDITIPPATPEQDPYVQLVRLTRCKITGIFVKFPPGAATLAHVVIRHNLHQLIPANYEGSLNFDDETVVSELEYDLVDAPYELYIIGWSPLAVYEHTITCQFQVKPLSVDTWDTFNTALFSMNNNIRGR